MPKLRHIAVAAEDPEAMAEFYKKAFDFVRKVGGRSACSRMACSLATARSTWRSSNSRPISSARGSTIAASIIRRAGRGCRRVLEEARSLGAEYYVDQDQGRHHAGYFEKKFYGPEHLLFDIAEHGWAGAEPLPAAIKEAAE